MTVMNCLQCCENSMNLIKHRLQNCFLDDHWTQSFMLKCAPSDDKSDRKTTAFDANSLSNLTKEVAKEIEKSPALLASCCLQVSHTHGCLTAGELSRRGKVSILTSRLGLGEQICAHFLLDLYFIFSTTTPPLLDEGTYSSLSPVGRPGDDTAVTEQFHAWSLQAHVKRTEGGENGEAL